MGVLRSFMGFMVNEAVRDTWRRNVGLNQRTPEDVEDGSGWSVTVEEP